MKKIYNALHSNHLFLFLIFQLLTFAVIIFNVFIDDPLLCKLNYVLTLLFSVTTYIVLYKLYKNIITQAELEAQSDILIKQHQLQDEHLKITIQNNKLYNQLREEIFTQLESTPYEAIKNEQEARILANELLEKYSSLYYYDYCNNKIVDSILCNKVMYAKGNHIKMNVHVILPEQINMDDIDLVSLFTNLIDNAIEATLKIEETKRLIEIESQIHNHYLIIKIKNSKSSELTINSKNNKSTKKDFKNHGLGLQIIQSICTRHHGHLDINDYNDTVEIIVTLQLNKSV
ncbi:MAG: ATP-binding protein [Bacilli bacterium]|nr:ATP-binding protein [Bacilli bacterium]